MIAVATFVTIAPQWVAEQLALFRHASFRTSSGSLATAGFAMQISARPTSLFGEMWNLFSAYQHLADLLVENPLRTESLDYHITHSSLVKEPPLLAAQRIHR